MTFVPGVVPPASVTRRLWFLVHRHGLVLRERGDELTFPSDEDLPAFALRPEQGHYLGALDGEHAFAAHLDAPPPAGFVARSLLVLHGSLPKETLHVAGRAQHVVDWASTHVRCGRCGAENERSVEERAMRCPRCNSERVEKAEEHGEVGAPGEEAEDERPASMEDLRRYED